MIQLFLFSFRWRLTPGLTGGRQSAVGRIVAVSPLHMQQRLFCSISSVKCILHH